MKKIDICVGTDINRNIRVRLSLINVDEKGRVESERYHSGMLMPGDSPQTLRDAFDSHLSNPDGPIPGSPWPKIPDEEWAEVEQIASILHTPERVAKRIESDLKAQEQFSPREVRK